MNISFDTQALDWRIKWVKKHLALFMDFGLWRDNRSWDRSRGDFLGVEPPLHFVSVSFFNGNNFSAQNYIVKEEKVAKGGGNGDQKNQ